MRKRMHSNNGRRGPCIHVLNGRVDGPKSCVFNYECFHCAFDQWLDHMDEANSADLVPTGKPMDLNVQAMQAA